MELTLKDKEDILRKGKRGILSVISVSLVTVFLLFLWNGDSATYPSDKILWYVKAFLFVALFFFVKQRVRLINWQSLLVTVLYVPIGYAYQSMRMEDADMLIRDRILVWTIWIILMIITDMVGERRRMPISKWNKMAVALFAATAFFMMFYRNGRSEPIVFLLGFLFYQIPMSEKMWKKTLNQLCYGWLLAAVIILLRCVTKGTFMNSGFDDILDLVSFVLCTLAICVYKLYQVKTDKERKDPEYVLWAFGGIGVLVAAVGVGMKLINAMGNDWTIVSFLRDRWAVVKAFAEAFNFRGYASTGIQVGDYFARDTHCTYVQVIYEYGYVAGALFVLWLVYLLVNSIIRFRKERKETQSILWLWMACVITGAFLANMGMYHMGMVMTLLITYPLHVNFLQVKKKA